MTELGPFISYMVIIGVIVCLSGGIFLAGLLLLISSKFSVKQFKQFRIAFTAKKKPSETTSISEITTEENSNKSSVNA